MEYKTDLRVEPYRKGNKWWFRVGVRDGFVFELYEGVILDWLFEADHLGIKLYRPESEKAKVLVGTPNPKKVCRIR